MHQNIIRLHDDSQAVVKLQTAINNYFKLVKVPVKGVFDALTERAVREFQTREKLSVDGIVGPASIRALGIDMTPSLLTEQDFIDAAKELGVSVAHVKAVAEVETKSDPFWAWAGNKTPILFERHEFNRQLIKPWKAGQSIAELTRQRDMARAADPDICNASAGGYGKFSEQYPKMARAIAYGETPALNSASWGTFQIMGYHAVPMGWHSVQAFVRAMQASQRDHLRAFVRVIKINPTWWAALKRSDWLAFARGYNGPAQKGYDERMAAAFKKFGGK